MDHLVICQVKVDHFTKAGTIAALNQHLTHFSKMGVTGLWLTSVFEANRNPLQGCVLGRFCNFDVEEIANIDPILGTKEDLKNLVSTAHNLGMKVFLEAVPHGVTFNSTLVTDHPAWFKKDQDGNVTGTWGMADFNFKNQELCEYFSTTLCDYVKTCGIDGYRCDLEPYVAGYDVWANLKEKCRSFGKEIILFSELESERKNAFDFDQVGVGKIHPTQGSGDFLFENNIVDVIKNGMTKTLEGTAKYYTLTMSNHDSYAYFGVGSKLRFGYELAFSPFIPLFYAGGRICTAF